MDQVNDLISRQAAIDALWSLDVELRPSAIDAIFNMLNGLPSVQPERKRGKWIEKSEKLAPLNTIWWDECSVCGHHAFNRMITDYCPNCGADMRGDRK